jgi:membrane protein required for colicin V production
MNAIDLVLLLPIGLAFIYGYRKGLILSIFSIIALVVAVVACMKVTSLVMGWIQSVVDLGQWLPFFAYLLTFMGAFLIVIWFGKLVERLVKASSLGIANKLSGAALGVLKACFLISLLFWLQDRVDVLPEKEKKGSFAYRTLNGFAPGVIGTATAWVPWVKDEIQDIEKSFTIGADSIST